MACSCVRACVLLLLLLLVCVGDDAGRRFLLSQYYSAPESVMEKVGIGLDGQKTASLKDNEKLECRICCEEFTGKEAYALACNHFFCRGCWAAYLSAKVWSVMCGIF